jgi:hypothetical protein
MAFESAPLSEFRLHHLSALEDENVKTKTVNDAQPRGARARRATWSRRTGARFGRAFCGNQVIAVR